MSNQSGYQTDKTISQVAEEWAESLLTDLSNGEIDNEYGYGVDVSTVVVFTLAGGGPAAEVAFTYDDDHYLRSATFTYFEMGGKASVEFFGDAVVELAEAFGAEYALPERRVR
jgi:hypothetical protein